MKQSTFIFGILMLTVPTAQLWSQNDLTFLKAASKPGHVNRSGGYINELNTKAVRHFTQSFPAVDNERWSTNADCYRVTFFQDAVQYIVDYSKKGTWRNTIRTYGEVDLPADIRRLVRTTYFDHIILTVNELHYKKRVAYFVRMNFGKTTKTIRVMDSEMEIIEEFVSE